MGNNSHKKLQEMKGQTDHTQARHHHHRERERLDQQSSDEPSSSKVKIKKSKSRTLRPKKISTCSGNKGR